jgi:hypothetical protein
LEARLYGALCNDEYHHKIAVTAAAPQNLYVTLASGTTARLDVSTDEGVTWTSRGAAFDTGQIGYNFICCSPN